jgi:hypothetical protein
LAATATGPPGCLPWGGRAIGIVATPAH